MKLTIQIKLLPNDEQSNYLLDTMRTVNAVASQAAQVGFAHKVYGQISIHKLCYYQLREQFSLGSQLTIRAIGRAVEAFASNKKVCPTFAPLGAVPLDTHLYRLIGVEQVSISTTHGRIRIPIVIGDYFTGIRFRKMGEADLVYRDGMFFLYVSVEYEETPPIDIKDWIGVDLGIVNIATDSTGEVFSGEDVTRNRRRRTTARKQYQRKGTKNAKRRLRKMSGRQARFQKQTNHRIAKRLVAKAKALRRGIVLEDLKNIRFRIEPTVSRQFKRSFGNWSFAHLRNCIEYKAKMVGIPVLTVSPRNTSRTCSNCSHCEKANRISQSVFKCKQCKHSINADLNAALNLRAKGLGHS